MGCVLHSDHNSVHFVKPEILFFKDLIGNNHIHDSPALRQALHMYEIGNSLSCQGGIIIIFPILQVRQLTLKKTEQLTRRPKPVSGWLSQDSQPMSDCRARPR